ncbi:MAG: chemotaxis-specific protein-glutamate methyltransferase CheB [Planctomycetes bacterium]|nr:chemotaxis-specific protein-glutamate methyltransferase CheB [Planctomycetota bacterium]
MTRVLIVDDSLCTRHVVADRLRASGLEVAGEAADGAQAVSLTHRLRPDVVLMDVLMPKMDGLEATRRIMDEVPTPVVIFSAYKDKKEAFKTLDALAAGALEVCAKPGSDDEDNRDAWNTLVMTIRAASQVPVTRLSRGTKTKPCAISAPKSSVVRSKARGLGRRIVVIGASTGGPSAVREILSRLPADFPAPVFVAVHCGMKLSSTLAEWLDRSCALPVQQARHRQPFLETTSGIFTAPAGHHLRLTRGRMWLQDAPKSEGCSPSVNELFRSAADVYRDRVIGVLLTGMGTDGAEGLKRIREHGGTTLVQDHQSCVVFGMPSAAISLGAAEYIVPLADIPRLLIRLVNQPKRVSSGSLGTNR